MLFVAHSPWVSQDKLGLPTYIERIFTETFNEKKPMEPIRSRPWGHYRWYQDGAPIPEKMRLPATLLMVCKGVRRFNPDFFYDELRQWVISARFRAFLQERNLLEGHYEESELTVISTSQKPLTTQPYYLWRLFRPDNELVDFTQLPRIVSPVKSFTDSIPPLVYYPELIFHQGITVPPLFYLDDRSYWSCFFCHEDLKRAMEQEFFLGIEFHSLSEYIELAIKQEQRFAK